MVRGCFLLLVTFKRGVRITGFISFSFPFVWAGVGGFAMQGSATARSAVSILDTVRFFSATIYSLHLVNE